MYLFVVVVCYNMGATSSKKTACGGLTTDLKWCVFGGSSNNSGTHEVYCMGTNGKYLNVSAQKNNGGGYDSANFFKGCQDYCAVVQNADVKRYTGALLATCPTSKAMKLFYA